MNAVLAKEIFSPLSVFRGFQAEESSFPGSGGHSQGRVGPGAGPAWMLEPIPVRLVPARAQEAKTAGRGRPGPAERVALGLGRSPGAGHWLQSGLDRSRGRAHYPS